MGGRRTDTSELSVEKNLLLKRAYFNGEITMTKRKCKGGKYVDY